MESVYPAARGGRLSQAVLVPPCHSHLLTHSPTHLRWQVRELAPACRYRVRVRASNEQGVSAWSAAVAVETDAADSTHRIRFEQMQVHEALGEGGFSIVYRGVYGQQQDGAALQVAAKRLKYPRPSPSPSPRPSPSPNPN